MFEIEMEALIPLGISYSRGNWHSYEDSIKKLNQPRIPAGSSHGGEFSDSRTSGSSSVYTDAASKAKEASKLAQGSYDPKLNYNAAKLQLQAAGLGIKQGASTKNEDRVNSHILAAERHMRDAGRSNETILLRARYGVSEEAFNQKFTQARAGREATLTAAEIRRQNIIAAAPVFYHGTSSDLAASIRKEGLVPGKGEGADKWSRSSYNTSFGTASRQSFHVYFTNDREHAEKYAHMTTQIHPRAKAVVFQISIPDKFRSRIRPDPEDSLAVRFKGVIPPEWIRIESVKKLEDAESDEIIWAVCFADEGVDEQLSKQFTEDLFLEFSKAQARVPAGSSHGGEFAGRQGGGASSSRVERAQLSRVPCTVEHQRKADAAEVHLAKELGAARTPDNSPFDLIKDRVGIEVKALLSTKNSKVTMSRDAVRRKNSAARKMGRKPYTVVIDMRTSDVSYYYRRGVGSFRVGNMTKADSIDALRALLS